MKKSIFAFCAIFALVSCQSLKEEWQPVFTFDDNEPAAFQAVTEQELMTKYGFTEFTTIQALKSMYKTPGVSCTSRMRPAASMSRSASPPCTATSSWASGCMSAVPA